MLTDDDSHISSHLPDGYKTKFSGAATNKNVYLSHECNDIRIRKIGKCIIKTGRINATFNQDGLKHVLKGLRYTRIWQNEVGNWYLVHEHGG